MRGLTGMGVRVGADGADEAIVYTNKSSSSP